MRRTFFIAVAALAGLFPVARAAERATLRNGFEVDCNHHAQVERRVRLFLGASEDNYIEFGPEEIAGFEEVPDPPPQPASTRTTEVSQTAQNPEVRLSPEDLREMLAKAGHEHNLDADLLASLVKAESGGDAHAVSHAGARGLMQLMPGTANEFGVEDSFEPQQNVRGGSAYLDAMLTRYHDNMALALAAYNAGPGAVDKYHGIPPFRETRIYVARVIHEFNRRVLLRETQAQQAVATAQLKDNGDR
jgi:hypothetical protein